VIALYYLAGSLLSIYLLWVFYIAVMAIKRVRDDGKLTKLGLVMGVPVLIVGLLLDFIVNVFVMTLLLLEPPRETTVTARLKRHHKDSSGWRLAVVLFFEPILDPFDPDGDHI